MLKLKRTASTTKAKPGYSFDPKRDGVSQSMLHTWLACREDARMSIVLGYTMQQASWPLVYGSISHDCLDFGYKAGGDFADSDLRDHLGKSIQAYLKKEGNSIEQQDMAEQAGLLLKQIIPAYFERWWKKQDSKQKWTVIESQFRKEITPTLDAVGKMDGGFIDHQDGEHYLLETKNKSRFDKDFENWLGIDLQLAYYLMGYPCVVPRARVRGAIYNLMRRPDRPKGKKDMTEVLSSLSDDLRKRPDHWFLRYKVKFTEQEIVDQLDSIHAKLGAFYDWWLKAKDDLHGHIDPLFNPGACERFGKKCKYLQHCAFKDLSGLTLKPQPHMELEANG